MNYWELNKCIYGEKNNNYETNNYPEEDNG